MSTSPPVPALLTLLERLEARRLRVLVTRAGAGPDAYAWAAAGHEVVAVEPVVGMAERCRLQSRVIGVQLVVLEMDVLHPQRDLEAEFDVVWERACFCDLSMHERESYVRAIAWMLKPGGHLYALFGTHEERTISEACIRSHFQTCFEILDMDALGPRGGPHPEYLATMRRRSLRTCSWKRSP